MNDWIMLVLILLAIIALGVFAHFRHGRTDGKLDQMRDDMQGEFMAAHTRADREGQERNWMLQGIRSSLEMLRVQVIALFRRDK